MLPLSGWRSIASGYVTGISEFSVSAALTFLGPFAGWVVPLHPGSIASIILVNYGAWAGIAWAWTRAKFIMAKNAAVTAARGLLDGFKGLVDDILAFYRAYKEKIHLIAGIVLLFLMKYMTQPKTKKYFKKVAKRKVEASFQESREDIATFAVPFLAVLGSLSAWEGSSGSDGIVSIKNASWLLRLFSLIDEFLGGVWFRPRIQTRMDINNNVYQVEGNPGLGSTSSRIILPNTSVQDATSDNDDGDDGSTMGKAPTTGVLANLSENLFGVVLDQPRIAKGGWLKKRPTAPTATTNNNSDPLGVDELEAEFPTLSGEDSFVYEASFVENMGTAIKNTAVRVKTSAGQVMDATFIGIASILSPVIESSILVPFLMSVTGIALILKFRDLYYSEIQPWWNGLSDDKKHSLKILLLGVALGALWYWKQERDEKNKRMAVRAAMANQVKYTKMSRKEGEINSVLDKIIDGAELIPTFDSFDIEQTEKEAILAESAGKKGQQMKGYNDDYAVKGRNRGKNSRYDDFDVSDARGRNAYRSKANEYVRELDDRELNANRTPEDRFRQFDGWRVTKSKNKTHHVILQASFEAMSPEYLTILQDEVMKEKARRIKGKAPEKEAEKPEVTQPAEEAQVEVIFEEIPQEEFFNPETMEFEARLLPAKVKPTVREEISQIVKDLVALGIKDNYVTTKPNMATDQKLIFVRQELRNKYNKAVAAKATNPYAPITPAPTKPKKEAADPELEAVIAELQKTQEILNKQVADQLKKAEQRKARAKRQRENRAARKANPTATTSAPQKGRKEAIMPNSPIIPQKRLSRTVSVVDDHFQHLKMCTRIGNHLLTCFHPHSNDPNDAHYIKPGMHVNVAVYADSSKVLIAKALVQFTFPEKDFIVLEFPKEFNAHGIIAYRPKILKDGEIIDIHIIGRGSQRDDTNNSTGRADPQTKTHTSSTIVGWSGAGILNTQSDSIHGIHIGATGSTGNPNSWHPLDPEVLAALN